MALIIRPKKKDEAANKVAQAAKGTSSYVNKSKKSPGGKGATVTYTNKKLPLTGSGLTKKVSTPGVGVKTTSTSKVTPVDFNKDGGKVKIIRRKTTMESGKAMNERPAKTAKRIVAQGAGKLRYDAGKGKIELSGIREHDTKRNLESKSSDKMIKGSDSSLGVKNVSITEKKRRVSIPKPAKRQSASFPGTSWTPTKGTNTSKSGKHTVKLGGHGNKKRKSKTGM